MSYDEAYDSWDKLNKSSRKNSKKKQSNEQSLDAKLKNIPTSYLEHEDDEFWEDLDDELDEYV